MPAAMPSTIAIHPVPRRIPPRLERLAWAWHPTWCLLCRLLLGVDGAAVRGRRDEPAVDSRPHYIHPLGKSYPGGPRDCAGRGRSISRGRGMVAGSGAILMDFLKARSFALWNVSYGSFTSV